MAASHVERFHENMFDLADLMHELIGVCYDNGYQDINPGMVEAAKAFLSFYDKEKALTNFITYSYPYWGAIIDRDHQTIFNNAGDIFKDLQLNNLGDKINAFKVLYSATDKSGTKIVSADDIEAVMQFFDSFIKIAIKYVHDKRVPRLRKNADGTSRKVYLNKCFEDIKLNEYINHYKMVLEFQPE